MGLENRKKEFGYAMSFAKSLAMLVSQVRSDRVPDLRKEFLEGLSPKEIEAIKRLSIILNGDGRASTPDSHN